MNVYFYNPVTGEYLRTKAAQKSPLEKDVYLLPANATFDAPPETEDNQAAVFIDDSWTIVPDYRGKIYYDKNTMQKVVISELGEIPENLTSLEPPKYHKWSDGAWIVDTNRKQEVIAELSLDIDQAMNAILAAGLNFAGSNFPLAGNAYSYNMSAASAYIIGQNSGGRELLTNSGTYVQVDDIAALVAAGEQIVTSTIKNAIDEKAALQNKTTQELINMLEV